PCGEQDRDRPRAHRRRGHQDRARGQGQRGFRAAAGAATRLDPPHLRDRARHAAAGARRLRPARRGGRGARDRRGRGDRRGVPRDPAPAHHLHDGRPPHDLDRDAGDVGREGLRAHRRPCKEHRRVRDLHREGSRRPPHPARRAGARGPGPMTAAILVVEDEPAIQELIAVNLARQGHEVRRAATADEALRSVAESLPDVILLDWMLPDAPGPTIARKLRAEARTREVPIIMLTARAGEDDKVEGLASGADDYITKPFSPRELEARIQAVLRRRTPQLTREAVEIESLVLNPATRTVTGKGRALKMGPTEFELLHFFMTHTDRVYARPQILD